MDERWRTKELSRKEVIEKYPQVPPITVLKTDVSRRGILYTDKAFDKVDINRHHIEPEEFMGTGRDLGKRVSPIGITLRDGSLICRGHWADKTITREPYYIDVVDDKLVLVDEDEVLEEVEFWEKPNFYDKYTSNGTPMWKIASGRPQRISIVPYPKCDFWGTEVGGCKYCSLFATTRTFKEILRDDKYFQDVTETVEEALKQKGRYSVFHMTSGSAFSGKEPFDDEVELYIKTLQAAGKAFRTKKFPVKLVASAFSEKQLKKLYENTGITTYTTDLEVLNEDLFNWICPGKAKYLGYREWKNRMYKAVDIMGKGNVYCGIVGGVEMAQPYGFKTEDEALIHTLTEADEIASHGISFAEGIWTTDPKSVFRNQVTPSLEYFIRLAIGLAEIRQKYGLHVFTDDYRRCGNHPNTDLARIDYI